MSGGMMLPSPVLRQLKLYISYRAPPHFLMVLPVTSGIKRPCHLMSRMPLMACIAVISVINIAFIEYCYALMSL